MSLITDKLRRMYLRIRFGFEYGLTEMESRCFGAFLEQLNPSQEEIVREHLAACAAVIRFAHGKYVVLKFTERPRESLKSFGAQGIELHVATIKILSAVRPLYCEILFEYGVLAGIEFSFPPSDVDPTNCKIEWTRLLVDLDKSEMVPVQEEEQFVDRPLLAELGKTTRVQKVLPPADRLLIETFVERLDCAFPDTLLKLLQETNGFSFPQGEFMGTRARTLPWPEINLALVAENEESTWAIALMVGDSVPRVQFLDEVAATPEDRTNPFIEVLAEFAAHVVSDKA